MRNTLSRVLKTTGLGLIMSLNCASQSFAECPEFNATDWRSLSHGQTVKNYKITKGKSAVEGLMSRGSKTPIFDSEKQDVCYYKATKEQLSNTIELTFVEPSTKSLYER